MLTQHIILSNIVGHNMLCGFGHHVVMSCDMLGVVGPSLKMVNFKPTTANKVALCCDRLAGALAIE